MLERTTLKEQLFWIIVLHYLSLLSAIRQGGGKLLTSWPRVKEGGRNMTLFWGHPQQPPISPTI